MLANSEEKRKEALNRALNRNSSWWKRILVTAKWVMFTVEIESFASSSEESFSQWTRKVINYEVERFAWPPLKLTRFLSQRVLAHQKSINWDSGRFGIPRCACFPSPFAFHATQFWDQLESSNSHYFLLCSQWRLPEFRAWHLQP